MTDEPVDAAEELPTVKPFPEGWHLVEAGSWQVSVAPDGLLMLPRHLHPSEVADFCAAAQAAADVGHAVIKANDERTTPVEAVESLPSSTFVRHTAEPPVGVKMLVQQRTGPKHQSAIGRPKGRDPRQPTPTAPVAPAAPRAGGRRGRTQKSE